ncbi:MAG TPA: beta galactosidase jelly roll domain-containing protein, partial [Pirellulales bacterium]
MAICDRAVWIATLVVTALIAPQLVAEEKFSPPQTARREASFDLNWKFFKEDKSKAEGAEAATFDDSAWQIISMPHTYNDVDSFRVLISHGGGDRGTWKGTAWYRKHFKLPTDDKGKRVLIEFEGMRQAGEIFLNGKTVGLSENGITPYGVDITDGVKFGDDENVLAVHIDNRGDYAERATGARFEWNVNDFNPSYGGINRHVWLHVTGSIFQTLPIYDGLKTTGVYIYPTNFSTANHTADITVESQVHNASADRASVDLSAVIVDHDGNICAKMSADTLDMVAGEKSTIEA